MTEQKIFDVIIVGGSYAGLSAAMVLGRSLRQTLVIDNGRPCNIQTPHSHNFLTQDGKTPREISTLARQQVEQYETVQFCSDEALSGKQTNNGFEIITRSGKIYRGRKLIFATGIKDKIPDIPGFAESWGISVIHCPYCHGFEYRGQKTGIMANGEKAFHLASLVNNLTEQLTILTNEKPDFTTEQINKLKKHNIQVLETQIDRIEHNNGYLKNVILKDGTQLQLDALYASVPFSQHSNIPESFGCELTESGYIKVDDFQRTTIPGIFACGDNSTMFRSIAGAVSSANLAGAMVNMELTHEMF